MEENIVFHKRCPRKRKFKLFEPCKIFFSFFHLKTDFLQKLLQKFLLSSYVNYERRIRWLWLNFETKNHWKLDQKCKVTINMKSEKPTSIRLLHTPTTLIKFKYKSTPPRSHKYLFEWSRFLHFRKLTSIRLNFSSFPRFFSSKKSTKHNLSVGKKIVSDVTHKNGLILGSIGH